MNGPLHRYTIHYFRTCGASSLNNMNLIRSTEDIFRFYLAQALPSLPYIDAPFFPPLLSNSQAWMRSVYSRRLGYETHRHSHLTDGNASQCPYHHHNAFPSAGSHPTHGHGIQVCVHHNCRSALA